MTAEKISLAAAWTGLGGYALTAPISIAASQVMFALAVAGFIGFWLTTGERFRLIFPPAAFLLAIAAYAVWRLVAMLAVGSDWVMIKEDWLFLMAVVGAVLFRDIKRLTLVLDVFAGGLLIMGGYGIWQHFFGVDLYHGVLLDRMMFGYRAIGTFSTYLTFSGFFAVASIFLVAVGFSAPGKGRSAYYLLASQIGLACILFNYSRSTIVSLVVGIIVLVLIIGAKYRKWVSLLLLLTLAVGLVISPDFLHRFKNLGGTEFSAEYANSRLAIWRTTLSMIEEKPIFGIGPGAFGEEYRVHRENRTGRNLSHAHNDVLNTAAESGLAGAVLFLLVWAVVLGKMYKGYKRCPDGFQKGLILGAFLASVVFLVMAQFEAFFADEEVRLLLMFIWGIGLAILGNLKASEKLSEIA